MWPVLPDVIYQLDLDNNSDLSQGQIICKHSVTKQPHEMILLWSNIPHIAESVFNSAFPHKWHSSVYYVTKPQSAKTWHSPSGTESCSLTIYSQSYHLQILNITMLPSLKPHTVNSVLWAVPKSYFCVICLLSPGCFVHPSPHMTHTLAVMSSLEQHTVHSYKRSF